MISTLTPPKPGAAGHRTGRLAGGVAALALVAGLQSAAPAAAQSTPVNPPLEALTSAEVGRVIAQAVAELRANNAAGSIAVVDRVGNVLGVFIMSGAPTRLTVTSNRGLPAGGLEGLVLDDPADPDTPGRIAAPGGLAAVAAIAKAVTGAYLSSSGNAFSTRTASQIVQEHFNPGERFQPSGPLYGVQFSQLPCSDLSVRAFNAPGTGGTISFTQGPKRSPLGLSADAGGLPLYKNGVVVGGIGVEANGIYTFDPNLFDRDRDVEELAAVAGTVGFDSPREIRADRVHVDGRSLRYADVDVPDLVSNPASAPGFATIASNGTGVLATIPAYFHAPFGLLNGTPYGAPQSGFRPVRDGDGVTAPGAYVLSNEDGSPRFAPRDGTENMADRLRAAEVRAILEEAVGVAFAGRAQIRRPLNSFIQVTIHVIDSNGEILGAIRTPDAPIFGTDVSLQKARTAAFFTNAVAAAELNGSGLGRYVDRARGFFGPTALTGATAFSDRAIGNVHRPYFADGIIGQGPGPFSTPISTWSPFNVGLQLDLVLGNVVQHVTHVLTSVAASALNGPLPPGTPSPIAPDTPATCTALPPAGPSGITRLSNGAQIFPGSVPIYRGNRFVGAIGLSGDGIDQDDMVSFLGLHRAGVRLNTGIGNAPNEIRADRLTPQGVRLRYVSCPFNPFLGSREQNPCTGK